MNYEWDEEKSAKTHRERGFGFEMMEDFDWGFSLGPEIQFVEGEEREAWIGPIGNQLYAVVATQREQALRIISLRLATNNEIRLWKKEFQND